MAVVLIADAGSPNANSFCDLATANSYFAGMLYADDWTDADVDTQTRALITATMLIVAGVAWGGWPASTTQALPMPRSGLRSRTGAVIPSTVIPIELANATAEYARQLITLGAMPTAVSDLAGIKSAKLGTMAIELDVDTFAGGDGRLPIDVWRLFAWLTDGSGMSRTCVPLERV